MGDREGPRPAGRRVRWVARRDGVGSDVRGRLRVLRPPLLFESGQFGETSLLGQSVRFCFESPDFFRHLAVGGLDLVADDLPVGDPGADLGAESFCLVARCFEFGDAFFEFDALGGDLLDQGLGLDLDLGLLGDGSAQTVDQFVLVLDDLGQERSSEGGIEKIAGVERRRFGVGRHKGIDGAIAQPLANRLDFVVERLGPLRGLGRCRLGLFDGVLGGAHTPLLECEVTVECVECPLEVGILGGEFVESGRRLGGISTGGVTGLSEVVDSLLRERVSDRQDGDRDGHADGEGGAEG